MSLEKATEFLDRKGYKDRIILFSESTATVPLAATALSCEEGMIAKTLSFSTKSGAILIVCRGDFKIDNRKYKDTFGEKAAMLRPDVEEEITGHEIGGVCPFGVNDGVRIFLDVSLKDFDTVYPAAGNPSSAVRLTPDELSSIVDTASWIDVCKMREIPVQ